MTRLRMVILEPDERAVLRSLGRLGVLQLTRTAAGPDTAPLSPRNRAQEFARVERLSSRLDELRRSLELPPAEPPPELPELSLDQVEQRLHQFDADIAPWRRRREQLREQLDAIAATEEKIADYRELDVPLDAPGEASFLHFITGTMPAGNFAAFEPGGPVACLPLGRHERRQRLVLMTTRGWRPELDRLLQQAGFQPEKLPALPGATTAVLARRDRSESREAIAELEQCEATLRSRRTELAATCALLESASRIERDLLEAEQHFPRTEHSVLVTGWTPAKDVRAIERTVLEITGGHCVIEAVPAEALPREEIPVLLRQPRLLRPFALLVTAYGLPRYRELEPTLFVALSYLLMFGMMFGDVGHGLVLALLGLALGLARRAPLWRDAGLLLMLAGGASMVFGALYGSCFGLESFKKFALWHDPLAGDPMSLMRVAIEVGIVMISLGLVLNIINRLRHGDFVGALLDKFGLAGALFYWLALVLFVQFAAIRSRGWMTPVLLLLSALVVMWLLKEPFEAWRGRAAGHMGEGGLFNLITESFAGAFEGLLSYFANTISFVRLAAYAMSHAALLLAAFMIAADVKTVPGAGGALGVAVIVLGNLVAIVLEGIVASVQALRLEYYEFFGKFFSGGGRPFHPFRLHSSVASPPP
ncbi:MAG TPA: V-type ATPase 116kDa subunit family protein [Verrucomicrobiae bacterium]|nr:V-type ATPase 116kDa subunit family protein [Verrucomicrobiae bacterium]